MVILAQALGEKYVEMLEKAYDGELVVLTGSTIKENARRRVYKTCKYNANSFKSRVFSWILFCADVFKILKHEKLNIDIVFAVSNPPINSVIAYRLKKRYKCKVIFMDWDIYPQIVERTFRNPLIQLVCKYWHKMNNYIFPKIDLILTIGEHMKKNIESNIRNPINIKVLSLFTDCNRLKPVAKDENDFCMKYMLHEKIVFIYSGKMGMGHNLDIILEAAKKMKSEEKIQFLLIGEGQRYKTVEDRICKEQIQNVILLPFQPEEIFPLSLACGDVAIVTQESLLADLFLPSKAYDMMAVGMPIIGICTKEDDLADLILENEIGTIVTDNQVESLVKTIKRFAEDVELRKTYARNARKRALEKYDEAVVAEQYKKMLISVK